MKLYVKSSEYSDKIADELARRASAYWAAGSPKDRAKLVADSQKGMEIARSCSDPEELSRLARSSSNLVKFEVMKNPATPKYVRTDLMNQLVNDDRSESRWWIAERTNDQRLLLKLASDELTAIREIVAKRATDPDVLNKLVTDRSETVRRAARASLRKI